MCVNKCVCERVRKCVCIVSECKCVHVCVQVRGTKESEQKRRPCRRRGSSIGVPGLHLYDCHSFRKLYL